MTSQVELSIGGMTCASCANRIERKLNKLDGVVATVNYATEKAKVEFPEGVSPGDLVSTVEQAGYTATLPAPPATDRDGAPPVPDEADERLRSLRHRLVVSTVLAVPVVALAMVPAWQFEFWQWLVARPGRPGGRVGRRAVPPRRVDQPAPRRHHDGHADLGRHPGGPRVVGLRAVLGHGRRARHDPPVLVHDRAHRRRGQHLPRGRGRGHRVHPRRPLRRGALEAALLGARCGPCSSWVPRRSPSSEAVRSSGSRSSSSWWATSSSSAPGRRSPPTAR